MFEVVFSEPATITRNSRTPRRKLSSVLNQHTIVRVGGETEKRGEYRGGREVKGEEAE
jgi:hypothetical protein